MNPKDFHYFFRVLQSFFERFDGSSSESVTTELPDKASVCRDLSRAFLTALSGEDHSERSIQAKVFLKKHLSNPELTEIAEFLLYGIDAIPVEISGARRTSSRISEFLHWIQDQDESFDDEEFAEHLRRVFCPEAAGVRENFSEKIRDLREKRKVSITKLNPDPVQDPARQVLFTSNVLLTLPSRRLPEHVPEHIRKSAHQAQKEDQLYWFDHPIPMGIDAEKNEVLYGLKGLEEALEFEYQRGTVQKNSHLTCVLSVSVTHDGLKKIAKEYFKEEISRFYVSRGERSNLRVFLFSEPDVRRLIDSVLAPAARLFLDASEPEKMLDVLGVNGEYGRHYSFLKAIAALWNVLIDPEITATFKIDLDQVFPQQKLVEQTGKSAFEHLCTPLWGASGRDRSGESIDLSMIAGALVNDTDIETSLFSPDVRLPKGPTEPNQAIFFSALPQAVSTEAEMMTRYGPGELDGQRHFIQRFHVTGGTNGILIDALFRHRPFTPSCFGRAEDQAYIFSVLTNKVRLAYAHKDGLIMRHDKESFIQEVIEESEVGKVLGDFIRILYFSEYSKLISEDISKIKADLDPFTGCFISETPLALVYLRYVFYILHLISCEKPEKALKFARMGAQRLASSIDFVQSGEFQRVYEQEKQGWDFFYDVLQALQKAIASGDNDALKLRKMAREIIEDCRA